MDGRDVHPSTRVAGQLTPRRPAGCIETELHAGVVVLRLLGDHDLATADVLAQAVATHAAAGEGVVVSLVETTFVDCSVVGALYRGDAVLKEHGRRLIVNVATEPTVRRLLEVTKAARDLQTTSSLRTALALAARRPPTG